MNQYDELDKQARGVAKQYTGEFAWPTVVLGLVVSSAYVATPLLVSAGELGFTTGLLLMIALTYASYTVLHDAVHGSISGSKSSLRWANEAMGYIAAWIMMIPLTAHRHEHLAHHRNTNAPDADPDYVVADMARSPWHALRAGVRVVLAQYRHYFSQRWAVAPRDQNRHFCIEILAAVGLRALLIAQGDILGGAVLFVSAGIGGVMLLMFLFAYIVHTPYEQEGRYLDTSTILVPGLLATPITLLWGFQNYHSIHHLFPRVPFYRYRQLYQQLAPTMRALGAPVYELSFSGLREQETGGLTTAS